MKTKRRRIENEITYATAGALRTKTRNEKKNRQKRGGAILATTGCARGREARKWIRCGRSTLKSVFSFVSFLNRLAPKKQSNINLCAPRSHGRRKKRTHACIRQEPKRACTPNTHVKRTKTKHQQKTIIRVHSLSSSFPTAFAPLDAITTETTLYGRTALLILSSLTTAW